MLESINNCKNTRKLLKMKHNLTDSQENMIFNAFRQIELCVGMLISNPALEVFDIKISNLGQFYPLPRIQRDILQGDRFSLYKFFNAYDFKYNYEKFYLRCLSKGLRTGADIYTVGVPMYTKSNKPNVVSFGG